MWLNMLVADEKNARLRFMNEKKVVTSAETVCFLFWVWEEPQEAVKCLQPHEQTRTEWLRPCKMIHKSFVVNRLHRIK